MVLPAYIDETTGAITDGEAWVALASTTLSSDTALITFTSPNDGSSKDWSQFMDLVIVWYARGPGSGTQLTYMTMHLNNDTSSGSYPNQFMRGNNNGVSISADTSGPAYQLLGMIPENGHTGGIFAGGVCYIFDINSGKYKSMMAMTASDVVSGGTGESRVDFTMWKNTAAVSEIDIKQLFGSNLETGSRWDLFGVLPRMVPA